MIVKAAQWGNSIGVRIPHALAKKKGIWADTPVEVNETEDGVTITPVVRREYTLQELVEGITPENRQHEVDFGSPVGKELI